MRCSNTGPVGVVLTLSVVRRRVYNDCREAGYFCFDGDLPC